MQDTERRLSALKCSKTALSEKDARSLLQEFAEQKRKAREKDPEVKRIKNKYRLKAPPAYPSPGHILHTGKQLPRTPGPGILPLLPSQQFELRTDEEAFGLYDLRPTDNMVPCGHQLDRTPTYATALREIQVNVKEGETFRSSNKSQQDGKSLIMCKASEGERTRCKRNDESCVVPEVMADLETASSGGGITTAQKEVSENTDACSRPPVQNNRRISEMPVTGLNQMRISGVLNKMAGYECWNEDLEFLQHMANKEKAKVLKEVNENTDACRRPPIQNNRRISEMPVTGLNQMRISGVLNKMAGYECRNEDLEFLKHMANQEKAKVLKEKLLCLKKDLIATNQVKELTLAKKEKIEADIEKMKLSNERTVQLGRALLSRTRDPTTAGDLTPDDVLKQLNSMNIHTVHQQTRLQLAAAEKELARRQQESAERRSLTDSQQRSLTLKVETNMQLVKEAQHRIQQLKDEVLSLKTQITRAEENKSELEASTQKKRQQISYCQKHVKQNSEMSEEEKEKLNRRLQRILHRKDNYLERERILQRLKEELK